MKLQDLRPNEGGGSKSPKRLGRGTGSGQGKTAGRGQTGQNSRSGGGVKQALKVAKCLYIEECLREVSQIYLRKNFQL